MVFSVTYTCNLQKGLNYMLKALKVSRPQNANMILFININNFFKWKYLHYDI